MFWDRHDEECFEQAHQEAHHCIDMQECDICNPVELKEGEKQ